MRKVFKVEDLDCAHCAAKIEEGIQKIDGVEKATLNFMLLKLTVDAPEEKFPEIKKQIKKVAKKVEPDCSIIF